MNDNLGSSYSRQKTQNLTGGRQKELVETNSKEWRKGRQWVFMTRNTPKLSANRTEKILQHEVKKNIKLMKTGETELGYFETFSGIFQNDQDNDLISSRLDSEFAKRQPGLDCPGLAASSEGWTIQKKNDTPHWSFSWENFLESF